MKKPPRSEDEGFIRMTTTEFRDVQSETIHRIAFSQTRVVLHRYGKGLVAVVPIADLRLLEAIESRLSPEIIAAAKERACEE